ncbi:hypothetical protein M5C95_12905 [Acidovorax sp. NCPPB 4044]|nr:hypothetical protein [Acidovorax sp. NCPPB 4044]
MATSGFIFLLIAGCYPIHDESNCEDEVLSSKKSLDGENRATLTLRSCGSTTPASKIIRLQKIDPENTNNQGHGERIYITTAEGDLPFHWEGNLLRIEAPETGQHIFLSKGKWGNTDIAYFR